MSIVPDVLNLQKWMTFFVRKSNSEFMRQSVGYQMPTRTPILSPVSLGFPSLQDVWCVQLMEKTALFLNHSLTWG